MKYIICMIFSAGIFASPAIAQQFVSKGTIEFEVTSNVKKTLGSNSWAEKLKENIPTFKIAYYNFNFAGNKSIYKFDHYDEKVKVPDFLKRGEDENEWFTDFNTNRYFMQKNVFGSIFNVKDTITAIQWKISNENRMIAGFNCRKAVGKIMDSVYVFAFYTDEITISGGPCSINGLPGMILGVTIPRLYTSIIATKLSLTGINENEIKPVVAKKTFTCTGLNTLMHERIKEWISEDEEDDVNWANQVYWRTLL